MEGGDRRKGKSKEGRKWAGMEDDVIWFPPDKKDSPSVNPRLNWGKGKSMDGRGQNDSMKSIREGVKHMFRNFFFILKNLGERVLASRNY